MKFLGFCIPHEWEKWKDESIVNVYWAEGDQVPIRRCLVQKRICSECGKAQYQRVSL